MPSIFLRTCVSASALFASSAAYAQSAGAPAVPAVDVDSTDIVVTAQKREQKLSEVPLTVLAASTQQLQNAGVTDVNQIGKIAPSFTVAASVYGYQVFSIRGIGFNSQQISATPTVPVYIDEAPIPYSAMTGSVLLDVERIEVLKGPQGTLFGQNATGGSINVIAAKPQSTLGAGFRIEANEFGGVTAGGYVTGPISTTLNARLAIETSQFGAWQRGYYLSNRKNGDQNRGAARLLLDWRPADRLKVAVNINGNYDKGEVIQPQFALSKPANLAAASATLINYPPGRTDRDAEITPGFDTHANKHMFQAVVRADYELADQLTLTSITDYIDFHSRTPIDYDGIVQYNSDATPFGDVKHFSQELRISGKTLDNRINFVLGANYSHSKTREGQTSTYGAAGEGYTALAPFSAYTIDYSLLARSTAIFGNVEFEVAPRLTLTAGARYTWAKETIDGCLYGNAQFNGLMGFLSGAFRGLSGQGAVPTGYFGANTCATINDNNPNVANPVVGPGQPGLIPDYLPTSTNLARKEHNVAWRVSADYKFADESLLYASISRGFKAGTYPAQPNLLASEAAPVKQEQLTSYEVGVKLALVDRTLRFNISGFHYDYRNKQFYTYLPVPVIGISSFIVNVPKSTVNGFDADFSYNPSRSLSLRGAVTYIDTKVKNFAAINGFGVLIDASNKSFNYAPHWTGNLDAEYRFPLSDSRHVYIGGGAQFSSKSYSDLGEQPVSRNPSYVLVDARIGVEATNRWRAGLFVHNLTNKFYWTSTFNAGDMFSRYAGLPRTFGGVVSFNF